MDPAEFAALVRSRRMVRSYSDHPVEAAAVERILDAARRGPSAGYAQGIEFVVVTDTAARTRIAALADEPRYRDAGLDPWLSSAPVHVVVCAIPARYRERYREPDKSSHLGPDTWPVPYWWLDAGAALMLVLLAATAEGLAAGFLGAHAVPGLEEALHLPEGVHPTGVVTIGHPAPDRRSGSLERGRRPLRDVVHREAWDDTGPSK